ncbi:MAG TPA: Ni/Fe-hydrogenase, b-type cytochrome subunit [Terriglobales bacterium]|nr:Ni/Fe-hydrogenase, b-type cytochrome subunit [Terriglobales bacterium]
MPKPISPKSGLARLSKTELVRTYVWQKPVRITHWLIFFSFLSLSFTGLYIHHPFLFSPSRAAFLMAQMRFVHVVSGFVLIAAFALRVYWFFKGNIWSRWSAYIPLRRDQWQGIGDMLEFYSFLRFDPGQSVGHNPLAALSYCVVYLLILVEILTGLALYDQVLHNPVLHQFIAWLPLLIAPAYLRLIHFFLMFVFFAFVIFHVYASVLVSIEEENGLLDSIFSGWKFMPAGVLRQAVAKIPEARSFVKRHALLPHGTPAEERAGMSPTARPGPSPLVLYRNWISYIGTGVAAVGALLFAILTAYHTIGGGALVEPYGDLVIFFGPPMFVILGVVIVLIGMYFEWIRWRHHKPRSFARYPEVDLNVASERKALLAVAIGAAVLSVPAIYGGQQAYLYTDHVSFCGASCHSMTPEFTTYQRSPHAHVTCAQCHVGPGNAGYIESKVRGMTELAETFQDNYPRPIPVPVTALRPVRGNCERCHWPANFFGSRELRRVYFLSDEQNTRWEIDMLVRVGGGGVLADRSRAGIHWHVTSKVEYVASDPEHQIIPWVRAVDPSTGIAKVFTTQPQTSTTTPTGEIRTMDCVDCHNRPSHIFQAPDRSVNLALANGVIDPSLPFIKQEGVAALAATYASQEQARQGIENTILSYYQKSYPQIYTQKEEAIKAAVAYLQNTYDHYFFPSMKVRWDTYSTDDSHFHFAGCFRCHDGQHKSIDGSVIPFTCNECHTILRQGKSGSMQTATGPEGLGFQHPVDIGDAWSSQPCNSCHTGGAL